VTSIVSERYMSCLDYLNGLDHLSCLIDKENDIVRLIFFKV